MDKDSFSKLKLNIEAILFSYGDWIAVSEISKILELKERKILDRALSEIEDKYDRDDFPFKIECDVDSRWRMVLKEEFEDVVEGVISNTELPQTVLKVLSVIAYEQPVSKTRLGEILGRSVKEEITFLQKRGFLNYEKKGIGKFYRVTKKFYDYFKIENADEFRKHANKNIKTYIKSDEEILKELNQE